MLMLMMRLLMMMLLMMLMPDDAADIERGHTAVVGNKDAFSSNCNCY